MLKKYFFYLVASCFYVSVVFGQSKQEKKILEFEKKYTKEVTLPNGKVVKCLRIPTGLKDKLVSEKTVGYGQHIQKHLDEYLEAFQKNEIHNRFPQTSASARYNSTKQPGVTWSYIGLLKSHSDPSLVETNKPADFIIDLYTNELNAYSDLAKEMVEIKEKEELAKKEAKRAKEKIEKEKALTLKKKENYLYYLRKSTLYEQASDFSSAYSYLNDAMKLYPDSLTNEIAYKGLNLALNGGEYSGFFKYSKILQEKNYKTDSLNFFSAMISHRFEKYSDAKDYLNAFLKGKPATGATLALQKDIQSKLSPQNTQNQTSQRDCGPNGVRLIRGSRGGCYYMSGNTKVYVDRNCCN